MKCTKWHAGEYLVTGYTRDGVLCQYKLSRCSDGWRFTNGAGVYPGPFPTKRAALAELRSI
jgi:hypothetical protein